MTDLTRFEQGYGNGPISCDVCEAMCLDAVDGALTEAEEAAFEKHVAGCFMCAEQLAEAKRGAAWMDMLKGHQPEPSAALLQNILAQTTGAQAAVASAAAAAHARQAERRESSLLSGFSAAPLMPVTTSAGTGRWASIRSRVAASFSFGGGQAYFQPRLAMTAAMAFFSIALTLNLTGLRPTDLRPSALHRTAANVSANAMRSFQSLRVVNQFESRVSDLRRDDRDPGGPFGNSDAPTQASPREQPQVEKPAERQEDKQATPNGTSELTLPTGPVLKQVSDSPVATDPSSDSEAHTVRKGA